MSPRVSKKIVVTESEKILQEAIKQSQSGRFLCWLEILWPNVRDIMVRTVDYFESQNKTHLQTVKAMTLALEVSKKMVIESRPDQMALIGRDRLIFMYFLQGFLKTALMPAKSLLRHCKSVQLKLHQPVQSGPVSVIVDDKIALTETVTSKDEVEKVLEITLSPRDVLILGDDHEVLRTILQH